MEFFLSLRILYEKIPQKVNFQHPLYTFCPKFRYDIENPPKFCNLSMKTPLADVTNDKYIPDDFVVRVNDG